MKKACSRCKIEKELKFFNYNSNRDYNNGYKSQCRKCENDQETLKRIKNYKVIQDLENEEWKWINGWEDFYKISTHGRIKSIKKTINPDDGSIVLNERLIKQNATKRGYLIVRLCFVNASTKRVHRLVAEAFITNPENLSDVNHKDFDKTNNHISNLEWLSNTDNLLHFYKSKENYECNK